MQQKSKIEIEAFVSHYDKEFGSEISSLSLRVLCYEILSKKVWNILYFLNILIRSISVLLRSQSCTPIYNTSS